MIKPLIPILIMYVVFLIFGKPLFRYIAKFFRLLSDVLVIKHDDKNL